MMFKKYDENLLDKNIKYYENLKLKLKNEILQMMRKPINEPLEDQLIHKWNNKLKSIHQKEKGIRRIEKLLSRLYDFKVKARIQNYIYNTNINLKKIK